MHKGKLYNYMYFVILSVALLYRLLLDSFISNAHILYRNCFLILAYSTSWNGWIKLSTSRLSLGLKISVNCAWRWNVFLITSFICSRFWVVLRLHAQNKHWNAEEFNPLNPELNPICYLLALLAHHFLHVSRIRVKSLTLRLLISYIYGAPILDVSRSHTRTQHSR